MTNEEAIKRLKDARSTIQPFRYVDEAIDYVVKVLEQEPCNDAISEDVISRKAVKEKLREAWVKYMPMELDVNLSFVLEKISELPSATPKPKTGKWIDYSDEGYVECPFCGHATNCEDNIDELHYCFYCGAKMESEE